MSGLTNYTSQSLLNWLSGNISFPVLPSIYCELFTGAGLDDGTGFTEVSGTGYTRVQVAGTQTVNGTTAAGQAVLSFGTVGAWITVGMEVRDVTGSGALPTVPNPPTVLSKTATTVTISANATGAGVGATDSIAFSAFGVVSGTGPSQIQNITSIGFAQATGTAGWGTVVAFGLVDGSAGGNLLGWDYLGNFSWLPFSATSVASGSGAVFTTKAHGYSGADPVVVTAEYGGTLPTLSQGTLGGVSTTPTINYINSVTVATDTFTLNSVSSGQTSGNAIWSSATGSGLVRKIVQQSIPQNVTASFAAAQLTITSA